MTQDEERVMELRERLKEMKKGLPEMPMKGRIRPGAIVGQDHGLRPVSMVGEGLTKVFDVHPFSETRVRLTAWGYGEGGKGAYGDGALYVAKEDVMPVDEVKKEPVDELAEEIYRAYAYFVGRKFLVGDQSELATNSEIERMFQAWLALKLAGVKQGLPAETSLLAMSGGEVYVWQNERGWHQLTIKP